jgi:hypothetical protein
MDFEAAGVLISFCGSGFGIQTNWNLRISIRASPGSNHISGERRTIFVCKYGISKPARKKQAL